MKLGWKLVNLQLKLQMLKLRSLPLFGLSTSLHTSRPYILFQTPRRLSSSGTESASCMTAAVFWISLRTILVGSQNEPEQQPGQSYHQEGSTFQNQELAIQYSTKSLESDPSDSQSWYLLSCTYMVGQNYNKAYEAYQQAVYCDGQNPTFWCLIGVLYFQINQFCDALDAYSHSICINPYISEVWFDLGSLYKSCNNQISDAIDA
ncbi:hypothetical protein DL96DRAFT_1718702 [Flagelloscypha sp. PMI_526]|nr:hypothetical protein DL96DRAFT_1718702 [Flagelloscypha sp. PMI_526]